MRRTLHEWEKLWRERWDRNDRADIDRIFELTDDVIETICEVELNISTQFGRIEIVRLSLFDAECAGTVRIGYTYTTLELDLSQLVQDVIASINDTCDEDEAPPEDKEDREEYQLGSNHLTG